MARILLIDDDQNLREVVRFILTEAGHEVVPAASGEEGLALFDSSIDVVLTDIQMPGVDGMEVLRQIGETDDQCAPPVIVITAHGTVEQAVAAMQLGAFTYITKPFAREELRLTVEQALRTRSLESDNQRLRGLLKRQRTDSGFVFRSAKMKQFMADLRQAADSGAGILIVGESGTGKELAARACHDLSSRWDQPFVAVNCGAIPGPLMESELFGHARGAFTGADRAATGRIRSAAGGSLLLDEIAELPLDLQPKLLRVLESRMVEPVGSNESIQVDFQLICATHRNLEEEVAAGRFREDLFYRINVLQLALPPLRERPEDVPLLWNHFTRLHAGRDVQTDPEAIAELGSRAWRGNVRELKNLNQRLVLMRRGKRITMADLRRLAPHSGTVAPATPIEETPPGGLPLRSLPTSGVSLIELEKEVIRRALAICGGNRSKTAEFLEIPRHVLVYRISKYEL